MVGFDRIAKIQAIDPPFSKGSMATTTRIRKSSVAAAKAVPQKAGYHHGSLRAALLDGALKLVRDGGIDAVTTRSCANLAGVSVGAIRNHFPDKRALLAGIAASGYELLAQRRLSSPIHGIGLDRTLEVLTENYVAFALEEPAIFRLMFAQEDLRRAEYSDLHQASQVAYGRLRDLIGSAFKQCGLGMEELDSATQLIWCGMHGLALLVIDRQFSDAMLKSVPIKERCSQMATVLAEGLNRTHARGRKR